MLPAERKVAMTIFGTNGGKYTRECVEALNTECKLTISQLQDIRVCIVIAKEHPETLDFEPGDIQNNDSANESNVAAIDAARAGVDDLNVGLDYFQPFPKDSNGNLKYTGEKLFENLCSNRNRMFATQAGNKEQQPPSYLDLHLYDDSLDAVTPSEADFNRGNVLSYAYGVKA